MKQVENGMNGLSEIVLPLSPMQHGMLFHTVLNTQSGAYFQQLVLRLQGEFDAAAFAAAFDGVVARHEALRAQYIWEGRETPVQTIAATVKVPIDHIDWQDTDTIDRTRLDAFLAEDRTRPFALDQAPLMRVTVIHANGGNHALIWSHHHLLLDGWSTGVVLEEFSKLYNASRRGEDAALPPAPRYGQFHQWLGGRDPQTGRDFWTAALAGFDEPTPIVIGTGKSGDTPEDFQTLHLPPDPDLQKSLERLTRRNGLPASIPVIAAWAFMLARYADLEDVVLGMTVAGRPPELAGSEKMVGLFINTVPVRTPVRDNDKLVDWLQSLQSSLIELRNHDHVALADIQEWSAVPRGTQLFESIFVFENYPIGDAASQSLDGLTLQDAWVEERANYPLVLLAEPQAAGLALSIIADRSRITEGAARQCLERVAHVLAQFAAAPDEATLADIPLLSAAEYETIVNSWNDTAKPYEHNVTLPVLFERQAERTPDAVAVIDDDGSITYRELDAISARIARRIAGLDLAGERPVGLRMARDRYLVAAMLGVLKAGRAYIPLEPQYPAARVHHIIDVLSIGAVISQEAMAASTAGLLTGRDVAMLVADYTGPAAERTQPYAGQADDLAYVIFTSGSTGVPKGVMVRHKPVINLIEWVNRTFKIGPDDRLLFITSPSFDLSVYDVFGILAAGGSVRVASDSTLADPDRLAQLLASEPVTFWDSAPAALWQLMPLLPDRLPGHPLRLVFLSGDWIPLPLPDRLKQCFDTVNVIALGGATEATVWSNFHPVGSVDPAWASIPYGRPIQNARYYILDSALRALPAGIPGDLYIGGECLADGYAGQAELTAERFIADPHGPQPGAKMYKTGDRARFYPDGVMEFLGRADNQVKVRGFRIELGEIEAVLERHRDVRDAVATVRTIGEGGPASGATSQDIVVYAVPATGCSIDINALRDHAAGNLPPQMVPAFFVALDEMPLTANGKIDYKALPPPEPLQSQPGRVGPADPLLDIVTKVWSDVLDVDVIGPADNFFDLGGHSLRATSVIARLRAVLGGEIPLQLLFTHPTPAGLAAAIGSARRSDGRQQGASDIPRLSASAGQHLSRAQRRLWFVHQMEPDSPAYNVALAAHVRGPLDQSHLLTALSAIIARHDVLRTRIETRDGEPAPVIAPAGCDIPLLLQDVTDKPPPERDDQILALLQQAVSRPFDLAAELPFRVQLIKAAPGHSVVLLLMDHIVSDGWSVAIFVDELLHYYEAAAAEPGSLASKPLDILPPLPCQYADWAAWHESWLETGGLAPQLQFWRERLAGVQELQLPTDRPRPAMPSGRGGLVRFELSEQTSATLRTICKAESCTLFMLLLAAFAVVLRKRSGQSELVVGTDVAGRSHEAAEKLIGFFVNELVLRLDLQGAASFRDILGAVRGRVLEAIFHQDLPFETLVQTLNPPREPGKMPLFQVKLVLQNAPFSELGSSSLQLEPIDIDTATAKYDLLMTFLDRPTLAGTLEYSADLFDATTAQAVVSEICIVLDAVAANTEIADTALNTLISLDESDRNALARTQLRRAGLEKLKNMRRGRAGT